MGKIYDQLCEINKEWDSGKFNILKGLKILGEAVRGSDLLRRNFNGNFRITCNCNV